ncbi:MAG: 2-dehydropantoate 2-reductase [Pseudomonadota bacterium]
MKIAVMGAGGVGGYFGARLAAAGEDVAFIARGKHLEALAGDGLRVESRLGDLHVRPVRATDRPAEIGPVDVVIFAVKLWDTTAAAMASKPLLGAETAVVSLQNGVEAAEILASALGRRHVIGGTCQMIATVAAPGLVRHTGDFARLSVGEFDGRPSPRVEAFVAAAKRAGIEAAASPDITRAIWEKFVFLSSFSGLTAVTRLPKGKLFADPDIRALFAEAVGEAMAVARARGIGLGDDFAQRLIAFADTFAPEAKSSMLVDLERGNRLELPFLSGAVARLGGAAGVPTPVHRFFTAALKLHAGGRSG